MKCLVLGADGFLGSHLTEALLKEGHKVRAFDRFSKGSPKNLTVVHKNLEIFRGNFFNGSDVEDALKGVETVFHFIWLSNPATSAKNPFEEIDINVRYSISLLEACVEAKIKRFVFASSGGTIYGETELDKIPETAPTNPISPYGIGKLTVEKYMRFFEQSFGIETVSMRISNPYGPRQEPFGSQGIVAIFKEKIKEGAPIHIFGGGENVRDYIFVKDAVRFIASLAAKKKLKHHVYNIGSGEGTSVLDVVKILEKKLGKKSILKHLPIRKFDVKSVVLCNKRMREVQGGVDFISPMRL